MFELNIVSCTNTATVWILGVEHDPAQSLYLYLQPKENTATTVAAVRPYKWGFGRNTWTRDN
jgi:hypothetical protein